MAKVGRKPLFHNGELNTQQQLAALLLGLGNTARNTAKKVGVRELAINTWKKHKVFQEEVRKNREEYLDKNRKRLSKDTLDLEEELLNIVSKGETVPFRGSDIVSALDKLARIRGNFAPTKTKKTVEYKELEKKDDNELDDELKELNEYFKKHKDTSNIKVKKGKTGKGEKEMQE